jgi:hypothetical protein
MMISTRRCCRGPPRINVDGEEAGHGDTDGQGELRSGAALGRQRRCERDRAYWMQLARLVKLLHTLQTVASSSQRVEGVLPACSAEAELRVCDSS